MRRAVRIGLLLAFLSAPLSAYAAPEVSLKPGTPASRGDCNGFSGDATDVVVTDAGRTVASLTFCAGYGLGPQTKAQLVDLGRGGLYALVRYMQGRGTSKNDYLTIYKVKSTFVEMLTLPIEWNIGAVSSFGYEYSVDPRGEKGFRLMLRGAVDDRGEPTCCYIVPEKYNMTIDIEAED